jgi:hypothetical protein
MAGPLCDDTYEVWMRQPRNAGGASITCWLFLRFNMAGREQG